MARRYGRMHGLAGFKEEAMEVSILGASALVGAGVAKAVVGFAADIGVEKDKDGVPVAATAEKPNKPTLPEWVPGLIPVAVAAGIAWGADKYSLKGAAKSSAIGVAAGMFAYGVGKTVVALLPKRKEGETEEKFGDTLAKYLPFNGLGADNYDTGLLAGLGQIDATVAAYMNRGLRGYPTEVQRLTNGFAGAPIVVEDPRAGVIGSPAVAQPLMQNLGSAPFSATLM